MAPADLIQSEDNALATTSQAVPIGIFEGNLVQNFILNGQTVVDVSSGCSAWLDTVLACHQNMRALLYSSPEAELSALRTASEKETTAAHSGHVDTRGTNLDADTSAEGIRHIHFLRIAAASMVGRVLKGAAHLLKHSRIDFVLFQLDTLDLFTGQTAVTLLIDNHYIVCEVSLDSQNKARLSRYAMWDPSRPRKTALLLAVQERLAPNLNDPPAFSNHFDRAVSEGVPLKGIIHIGAHDGSREVDYYDRLLNTCLMIEANPEICKRLEKRCQGNLKFIIANKAILDKAGPLPFYLTSFDESSSILKPATVLDHYEYIHEEKVEQVQGITLDGLLEELKLDPKLFNLLTLDIQGAELLALKGAVKTLPHIDFLSTEVNFENLYEGCAQIEEIDDFLAGFGFSRVFTVSPHYTWGDTAEIYSEATSRRVL